METALELKGLCHRYGKFQSLDNLNLSLEAGKIYGLLGRNGAGKTTLLNVISGLLFPSQGQALVFGRACYEHPSVQKRLCVVREKAAYPRDLRVREALKLGKMLYPNWDEDYAQSLLETFELNPRKKARQLSRGMVSSLGLVIGLASRAELTIFDEPSLGLDAVARERFYDEVIHDFESHPRTAIISTHLIDEVSRLFEEVVMVDGGKILLKARTDELLSRAVTLTGAKDAVERAIAGHSVLHRDELGGMTIASIVRQPGDDYGDLQVDPVPLQKLFVYLTEGGKL